MVLACGVIGSLGRYYWVFDLFSHFVPQYTIIGGGLAFLLLLEGEKNIALVMFVFAAIHAYMMEPLWKKDDGQINATNDTLTILQYNVNKDNLNTQAIEQWLFSPAQQADMVVLLELTPHWDEAVKQLSAKYPYYYVKRLRGERAAGIFSKVEINHFHVRKIQGLKARIATFDILTERYKRPVSFVVMHPTPPVSASRFKRRNKMLSDVAHMIADQSNFDQEKTHVVLVGDLNITRWSGFFKDFIHISGLHDAQEGKGYMGTWPSFIGSKFGIDIDHTLISSKISVIKRQVGPNFASDHLPVITTLSIPTLQGVTKKNL